MRLGFTPRLRIAVATFAGLAMVAGLAVASLPSHTTPAKAAAPSKPFCANHPQFCTETVDPWNYQGQYTGHDEPSLLFYSNTAGAGNSNLYQLTLPKDPPTPPNDSGTGGTWNFQLHPAFWFGMALCDDQSAPNPGAHCTPNSDSNIYTSTDPRSPNYFGLTPGEAYMEMQFYPPGWGNVGTGISCGPDNTQWCAALNIDSFSQNANTGVYNNSDCLNKAGVEYVNYAIITLSGRSQAPADPLRQTLATFSTGPDTLEMNSGDQVSVDMHDTNQGFQVVIHDATTGQTGSMTASVGNGFGHPLYQPNATTCHDQSYAFHPMFSTSSENTRVLWAAHSYNVAYSDEIGHFEYCSSVDPNTGACTAPSVTDPSGTDSDDVGCFTLPLATVTGTPSFSGCLGQDLEFDGPEYQHNWPGSIKNPKQDAKVHAAPVTFTSPLFNGTGNYDRVAFETDLPRIEDSVSPCRHTGVGCTNPPSGASFYPIYSTATAASGGCVWEEGDAYVPNVTNNFGGSSATEYGTTPFEIFYPGTGGPFFRYNDFRTILSSNPCTA